MADCCASRHAVAVSSGTAALHLIVRALEIGAGDEVITTPFSFVASANVMLYEGALPRFVDIDPETYNLDPEKVVQALSAGAKAILAVDVFGLPARWQDFAEIARTHDLLLIDDACEALGARQGERPACKYAGAAAFGFYPNKQITTGEGGCITTDSDRLAALCRSMRNQGRAEDSRMEHVRLGFNYRMDELSAALGCAQLERLPEMLARRRAAASWYASALAPLGHDLHLPAEPAGAKRSWFVYVVRLAGHFADSARDELAAALRLKGIGCAPYFPSIHLQPYYRKRFGYTPGDFPVCEAVSARTLALPFHNRLTEEEAHTVSAALKETLPALPRSEVSFPVSRPWRAS